MGTNEKLKSSFSFVKIRVICGLEKSFIPFG